MRNLFSNQADSDIDNQGMTENANTACSSIKQKSKLSLETSYHNKNFQSPQVSKNAGGLLNSREEYKPDNNLESIM